MTTHPTLREVADQLALLADADPAIVWYTSPTPLPNGKFHVDHNDSVIYLDGRLTGDRAFQAFLDAAREIQTGTADGDVIPMRRRTTA